MSNSARPRALYAGRHRGSSISPSVRSRTYASQSATESHFGRIANTLDRSVAHCGPFQSFPAEDDLPVEHSNVAAYCRTADAFRARDTEALAELIDRDVIWHVPGISPLAGEIRGREALFEWFDRLHEITDGTFTLKEHDVLGTDDQVVALSEMGAVRDGAPIVVNVVSVMHFRDGRQQEQWFHPQDPAAWDVLLGSPADASTPIPS